MTQSAPKPTYIFINPNTPEEFEQTLKRIMIEKILSLHKQEQPSFS